MGDLGDREQVRLEREAKKRRHDTTGWISALMAALKGQKDSHERSMPIHLAFV